MKLYLTTNSIIIEQQQLSCSPQVTFQLQPARVYLEDTFVYYIKTLFNTYIPSSAVASESQRRRELHSAPILPEQVHCSLCVSS